MLDRQALKSALATTPECLPLEKLEELSAEGARAHNHVSQCARCQAELVLLREFETSEPLPGEGAAVAWISAQLERQLGEIKKPSRAAQRRLSGVEGEGTRSWFSRLFAFQTMRIWLPVTAALVLAVAGIMFWRSPKEPELHASMGNDPAIYRSLELRTIAPSGELSEIPKELKWKAVSEAAAYKVVITEVDHSEVWSGQTVDTFVTIPESVAARIKVSKPFIWQVTALDQQGKTLASSQARRFVVVR
jgi:hypothetical protein